MAKQFITLPVDERRDVLQSAATGLGRRARILEKDIWVCWLLQILFSMPEAHPMAFKGGTSLSKVYNVINRFSEDVDITLDYRSFDDEFDPFAVSASRSGIRKLSERLKGYVSEYAKGTIVPFINDQSMSLSSSEKYEVTLSDNGEEIRFRYPSVAEGGDDYLRDSVLIELGGRNVIKPNERHFIKPDISDLIPEFGFPSGEITVLSPERTFWEKATLIHVECNRKESKIKEKRLSRHWYDLAMLANCKIGKDAINNRELLEDVVRHKDVFFYSSYANYDDCLNGMLRLKPEDEAFDQLRMDYEKMLGSGMIYETPSSFEKMISEIESIEELINGK